jgi:penicillin-binding protein 1A
MKKFLKFLSISFALSSILIIVSSLYIVGYFSRDLPDYEQLKQYNPNITTRLYSNDGLLLKEYAKERRLFVPIAQVPDMVKNAFIAAEDANFYKHPGIDFKAIINAAIHNIGAISKGKSLHGASTITQQVAKNFLLTRDRTINRKIKEAILAFRMTQAFSKDQILELYLNQIYLGSRSYGIASAALNYFDKPLEELTLEEVAMLAALPKSPGKVNPLRNYARALERRNWVLKRMHIEQMINRHEYDKASNRPINIKRRAETEVAYADCFAEEVRKQLVTMYGEESILTDGKVVTTTLDPRLQKIADEFLKKGLERYDMRHGWRGPLGNIKTDDKEFNEKWYLALENFTINKEYNPSWEKAVVLGVDDKQNRIVIGLTAININENINKSDNFIFLQEEGIIIRTGYIYLRDLRWARRYIDVNTLEREILKPSCVGLKKGDVIVVEKRGSVSVETADKSKSTMIEEHYALRQIPELNGSVIIMDPHNGRVLAMMGGYMDSEIAFNRATQAERQPGSILKTFGYLAALENGFTPADIVMDEEIILDQGVGFPPYNPRNYSGKFYGPTTLRRGLELSRNVATVRMSSELGLDKIVEVIKRFGINRTPRKIYSIVLGSTETTLLRLTNAYAMIVNGGKVIQPAFIERIQDKNGQTIYRRDQRICENCIIVKDEEQTKTLGRGMRDIEALNTEIMIFPQIPDDRKKITDSATAYQVTSMLEGVVTRGTGWLARSIGKTLGGKTGTTNNIFDAWFIGFSPDLVIGVYVGFDEPKTLGKNETGSSVALPIFRDIMNEALKGIPSVPFRVPPTVKLVKIDRMTGRAPTPVTDPKNVIFEAFKIEENVNKPEALKINDGFIRNEKFNNRYNHERNSDEYNEYDEYHEYLNNLKQQENILDIKKERMENMENENSLGEFLEDLKSGIY